MAPYQSNQALEVEEREEEDKHGFERLCPSSQCLNTSILSLCILGFAEIEIPIEESKIMVALQTYLLPVNSCFSSTIVTDNEGVQWWKKVEVRVEDHIVIPTFPTGLTPEAYDQHFKDYLSKIGFHEFPKNQPLWEVHILKYPRPGSAGTLVFKMHHALGDGFSIMGAVFSCFKRVDNPSLPLTFPSSTISSSYGGGKMNICKKALSFGSTCWNTVNDFVRSVLHSTVLEDSRTAVRSGTPQVELMPINITWVTFSMDDIRQVKNKIKGTVNDVLVGILSYGVDLYTQEVPKVSNTMLRKTALVLLNTRMVKGYRNLEEMHNDGMWGNSFSFMHIPIPSSSDNGVEADPLTFIYKAKEVIQRKRKSMDVFLNAFLLRIMVSLKGAKTMSQYMHSTLRNSTMTISNLVGPTEKMQIVDHPINGIYFCVVGVPQSLIFTVLSYDGKLKVVITAEKELINLPLLVSCLNESFKKIFKAVCG